MRVGTSLVADPCLLACLQHLFGLQSIPLPSTESRGMPFLLIIQSPDGKAEVRRPARPAWADARIWAGQPGQTHALGPELVRARCTCTAQQ